MKSQTGVAVFLSLFHGALSQQSPYGQCGGIGWDGPITCSSDHHCAVQNDWYWQCVPGKATTQPPDTTLSSSAASAPPSSETSSPPQPSTSPGTCEGSFDFISAEDYVAAINPGWNLGNTLDAIPNEDSWNNNPVEEDVFDYIVEQGFKSVRIPVTWTHHYVSESPDWTIDPDWLQRVEDVIDLALARGLYVVTNVHHDSWEWADVTEPGADVAQIQERFRATWYQFGVKLRCKSSLVSFESINEPPAETAEHGALVNEFNDIFLEAVTEAGGFNAERVVQFTGGVSDSIKTTLWFEPPKGVENPWALQFHYYGPYDFIFSAWGKTTWGSPEDHAILTSEIEIVRGNFTSTPLVLGEYDASLLNTENAARWKWFDHLAREATDIDAALFVWDNGLDHLDRNVGTWRDPVALAIVDAVIAGESNSLPASTTDVDATEQWSSAFVWNRAGIELDGDYALPWLFNGNELVGVTAETGDVLVEGADADYYVTDTSGSELSSDAVVFTQGFLERFLGPDEETGSKANLTLTFSEGAFSIVEVIQWDTPDLLVDMATSPVPGQDMNIPVEYNGWKMVAAVRVQGEEDGTILFDDWTEWLGPLQRGRATFNNHWFFDGEQVVIRGAAVQAVADFGSPVEFEFEFYPRVEGNSVTMVLDPADF